MDGVFLSVIVWFKTHIRKTRDCFPKSISLQYMEDRENPMWNEVESMKPIKAILVLLLSMLVIFGCTVQKTGGKGGKDGGKKENPNAALAMDFGTTGEILVTLSDVNKMAIIDMATFKVGDTIDVGINPQDVKFAPDGKHYYAVMTGKWLNAGGDPLENIALMKDAVWTWDHATHKIMGKASTAKSDETPRPAGFAITSSSDRICVANMSTDELLIKNLGGEDQKELARVKVGAGPRRVFITPDNKYAITINTDLEDRSPKDSISFVHLLSLQEEAKIEVGPYPWTGVFSPDGKKRYVSISGADEVDEIDIDTRKITNHIKIGQSPRGLALSSTYSKLYVASYKEDKVIPYDLKTGTIGDAFAVGKGPVELTPNKDGLLLFVANETSKSITVLNLTQNLVVETVRLSGTPSAIAIWTGPPPESTFPSETRPPVAPAPAQKITPPKAVPATPNTSKPPGKAGGK